MTLAELDMDKVYSYADYLQWNFKERVELIKGKLFKMSPAPNRIHQRLVFDVALELGNYLKGKKCQAFVAPFDVRLPKKTQEDGGIVSVVQPDICVVCDESKLDVKGCLGAPDLVVEILSPGNNTVEVRNKYELYEQSGVKEYWVVSPQDRYVLVYTLENERYISTRPMTMGDIMTSFALPGFSLDLTELFKAIDL